MDGLMLLGIYAFLLALVVGVEAVRRLPPILTPAAQALASAGQGLVLVAALLVLGRADSWWLQLVGVLAVAAAAATATGGIVVAHRLAEPFTPRDSGPDEPNVELGPERQLTAGPEGRR